MEMDIYMRRRLVAAASAIGALLLIVLIVRACGNDGAQAPIGPVGTPTPVEEEEVALTSDQFIEEADAICAGTNRSIARLDPAAEDLSERMVEETERMRAGISALQPAETPPALNRYLAALDDQIDALDARREASDAGDDVAWAEANAEVESAQAEMRDAGERFGLIDCAEPAEPQGEAAGADPGVAPGAEPAPTPDPDTGGTAAPTPPPADQPNGAPDADTGTGGISP